MELGLERIKDQFLRPGAVTEDDFRVSFVRRKHVRELPSGLEVRQERLQTEILSVSFPGRQAA